MGKKGFYKKYQKYFKQVLILVLTPVFITLLTDVDQKIMTANIGLIQTEYQANQGVVIDLGWYNAKSLEARVIRVDETEAKPISVRLEQEGDEVRIEPVESIVTGKYRITLKDKGKRIYEQDFLWGVLAINTDRSVYSPNQIAKIHFGVLDEKGDMVCDASLELKIKDQDGKVIDKLTTETKQISVNEECYIKDYTEKPDYEAEYQVGEPGIYTLELEAKTPNGEHSVVDSFEVSEKEPFEIVRTGPTRIYPPKWYPVHLKILANQDFNGEIVERVPATFEVTALGEIQEFSLKQDADSKYLIWDVELKAGDQLELGYEFDAPDVSPQFYTIGGVELRTSHEVIDLDQNELGQLIENDKKILFEDTRKWQIASDSIGYATPTRLWSSGFELQSATAGIEYTANVGTPSISTTTYRSGAAALRTYLASEGTAGITHDFATTDSNARLIFRAYLNIDAMPSVEIPMIVFQDAAGSNQASIGLDDSGNISLWNEEDITQIGSDYGTPLSTDTWYRLEIMADFGTAATGDTLLTAQINGEEFASSSTLNWANGVSKIGIGILAASSGDIYWDDLALNQDGFNAMSNWVGEGKIVHLRPTGNGSNTAWTGDYTAVDEITPNDATDYINCTAASQNEDYSYENASDVGIGSNDQIRIVEGWVRVGAAGTGARTHILSISDGTNTDGGPTTSVNSASWFTNDDNVPRNAEVTSYDAAGSTSYGVWTPSTIDSLITNINTTDCTPNVRISTVWILVEYNPAEGGRLFSSGYELQSTTAGVEWTSADGTTAISTSTYRSGAAALQVSSLSSSTREALNYQFAALSNNGPYYARAYLYVVTPPSAENRIIDLRNTGGTALAYITLDNNRQLKLYDEDGQVGSASSTLDSNRWYRIELKFDGTGAGSTDIIEAKIEGISFATSSTRNLSAGVAQFGAGGNLNSESETTGEWYFDDIGINRNIGDTQNEYPGNGRIVHLHPNANGNQTTWLNTYTNIDEVTPNDATDVITTSTLNAREENNHEDSSSASIPTAASIKLISAGVRASSTGSTAMNFILTMKDINSTNAPIIESAKIETNSTTWFTNAPTGPMTYPITAYTRPSRSVSITTADLDNLQIGVRETTDNTDTIQVSTIWALVEYDAIDIIGTCNAYDQTTDCGDTGTVRVAVNGTLQSQTQPTVAGTWKINNVATPASGDVITVFIDGADDADEAVAVTKYDGTGDIIAGVNLYKEHLTIGSEDNQTITNPNLSQYDNTVSGDEDIFFDVNGSNVLTVDATSQSSQDELIIKSSNTFQPGTSSTVNNIEINGTLNLGSTTLTIEGSWDNNGAFADTSNILNFSTTSTAFITGTTVFNGFSSSAAGKTIRFEKETTGSPLFSFNGTIELTGSSGNLITLNSDTPGTQWLGYIRDAQSGNITYANIVDAGCAVTSETVEVGSGSTGSNYDSCWIFPSGNAPNSPSSLTQRKVDDTTIATGEWTNETSVEFTVSASDPDGSDTLYLCIEKDQLGTSFSNTEDSCSAGSAYSGSPITILHTISSMTDAQEYHWQARVKDSGGLYSSWVQYGGNAESARDFGIDTTAPTGGSVYDGTSAGVDLDYNDGSLSSLSANWDSFNSNVSGLLRYDYSIGTTVGGTQIKNWTDNGTTTSVTATSLTLQTSTLYYFNVRAVDNAGNIQSSISSDGQMVAPTLTFSISSPNVTFSNLNPSNSFTDTETTTLTTSTNAYNGYVIRAFSTSVLTSTDYPSETIPNFTGGSYASPDEWLGGDLGFGYNSSDTSIQGSNIFNNTPCPGGGNPPCYAPFSQIAPGDIVADHIATVSGSPISNEQFTITYKVETSASQAATAYTTIIIYTVTPTY